MRFATFLRRRLDPGLADELASEIFTHAFARRATYDIARPSALPWLYGIATNLVRRHRRSEARRLRAYARAAEPEPQAPDLDAVDARLDASASSRALAAALASLAPRRREALLLFAWTELSYEEIAAALDVPVGTVRSRIHRARAEVRELIAAQRRRSGQRPDVRPGGEPTGETMTDELDHLRSFRADSAPSEDARRDARAALMAAVTADRGAGSQASPARARWYRRRPRPLAAVATFAVLLGGLVAAVSGLDGGSVEPAPATAKLALEQAAVVAADGDDVALAPGEYWYSSSEHTAILPVLAPPASGQPGTVSSDYTVLAHFRREAWQGPDGDGRIRHQQTVPPEFLDQSDRQRWIDAGRPPLETGTDIDQPVVPADGSTAKPYPLGSTMLSYEELRALPTDTAALTERLRGFIPENRCTNRPSTTTPCAPTDADMALFQMIAGLLRETPAPPELRAALYRVAAEIPGIRLSSQHADSRGRTGVAVSLANPYERRTLVFDPDTAALLAERAITLQDQRAPDAAGSLIPAGTETEIAYLDSGPVDSPDARP